jgi:RNA polymerase sigma-70 factor, ECF subfamily
LNQSMDITRDDVEELLRSRPADASRVFEAMDRAYRAPLYRLALSILNDADEAEDAVQDAFIRAARSLDRYRAGTNFKAWLYTIAINTCRDHLRKRSARSRLNRVWGVIQFQASLASWPETTAIENESRARLWELVGAMGEKHRLVVILRVGQGLSIQEISEILEINEKTVYSRLYQAFKQLRQRIEVSPEHTKDWDEHLR